MYTPVGSLAVPRTHCRKYPQRREPVRENRRLQWSPVKLNVPGGFRL